jgi:hypothetical protein
MGLSLGPDFNADTPGRKCALYRGLNILCIVYETEHTIQVNAIYFIPLPELR